MATAFPDADETDDQEEDEEDEEDDEDEEELTAGVEAAELAAELERNAVPVVTLAADALPLQAGFAPSVPAGGG